MAASLYISKVCLAKHFSKKTMKNMKTNNKAIILINKRTNLNFSNYTMPLANFTKYPLFLFVKKTLLDRISLIKTQYSIKHKVRVFYLNTDNARAYVKKELENKGGVYIFWCKANGLFYVGSAIRFITNKGRLNDYFMKGRVNASLAGLSTKVSKKLAESFEKHSISNFTLLTVEAKDLTKKEVQLRDFSLHLKKVYLFHLMKVKL